MAMLCYAMTHGTLPMPRHVHWRVQIKRRVQSVTTKRRDPESETTCNEKGMVDVIVLYVPYHIAKRYINPRAPARLHIKHMQTKENGAAPGALFTRRQLRG